MSGRFAGIVKFDLTARNGNAVAGQISHGPDCYGGEAVFVPAGPDGAGVGTLVRWLAPAYTDMAASCSQAAFCVDACFLQIEAGCAGGRHELKTSMRAQARMQGTW